MWNFAKKLLMYRVGQRTVLSLARTIGFGRFALLTGVVAGLRYMYMRRRTA